MRILILTQHFAPEVTAARVRLEAFAEGLAERGHEVEVVCEVPNHPEGVVRPEFKGRVTVRKTMNGVKVHYVWVRASPRKTAVNRVLLYGSYAAMATVVGSSLRRPDVVLASSPPLPVAAAAALVAARHRVPWVFDVRDLWPEAAIILGELSDGRVARLARRLEHWLYRSAAAIVTVTEPFRSDIARHIEDPGKISVITNGTTRTWLDIGASEVDRAPLSLPEDRFVWAYAGNLGIAQGLEAAIDAAGILGDGYQLLLLGDGPVRESLHQRAQDLDSGAVAFHGLVEPAVAARYLRAADALLVPLDAQPALRKFVPSKLFDCCAVGRPVIVAAAGEPQRLVAEGDAGIAVPPADAEALAGAVRRLRDDPALGASLGEAGRAFASQHLRERQVAQLEEVLRSVQSRSAFR
ncbi:MAG TPA: glycosyltransferase family 4 protein [Solirubrobacterales bacterium]|nr:glycosyltransferase family 4 protein [Solirubrobacterales bacterium]